MSQVSVYDESMSKAQLQALALSDLRGLPESAHFLVMCAASHEAGAVLDGSKQAFRELVEHISDEVAEGMLTGHAATTLRALCVKIDPTCARWFGA
jgi:hypothetical protein